MSTSVLRAGLKSPLLPISIRQPFGLTHCYAKFCLIETEEGIDVMFSPKLKEADLSAFTDKERSLLLAGKVIVSDIEETILTDDGEETQKVKAFVQARPRHQRRGLFPDTDHRPQPHEHQQ